MIEITQLNKSFTDKQVLFDINATFEKGKPNLVIGASGCGKSVMLKCMVGLETPETGGVKFDGRDFHTLPYEEMRNVRREIGMLFQGTALFDSMTVEENVGFPLKMFTRMTAAERRERVDFCLHRVNLDGVNAKYPGELSGGMKKRVGIARAIALDIRYLFCDEPNSGLDPVTSRVIDSLLLEITEEFNITTVINSHDMKTVFDIGENIIFIYKGKKWWQGHRSEITEAVEHNAELKAFLDASYFG